MLPNFRKVDGIYCIHCLYNAKKRKHFQTLFKFAFQMPSNKSDADERWPNFSPNNKEFLIGWVNSARDRKWKVRLVVTTGGCMVRSNGHPSPSNTVRCFPSLGFLPFQQESQFTGCLHMWKYTVYIQYAYVCVCVLCAFKHACSAPCTYNCLCLNVCVQMIHMDAGSHVLVLPLWLTGHGLQQQRALGFNWFTVWNLSQNGKTDQSVSRPTAGIFTGIFTVKPLFFLSKAHLYCVQCLYTANI